MTTDEQKVKIKAWQAAHKDKLKEYAARHKAKVLAQQINTKIETEATPEVKA
ncbi:MAG: hypothetical protein WC307_05060 [Candidatus Nanoarchaeia archaeon]|jgi:phosphoribosylformimino-5-aminoimidazole carboxamide ribonucleotide (ProFAR) isomerase